MNNSIRPTIETRYARIERIAADARHPARARTLDPAIRDELQEILHVATIAKIRRDRSAVAELHRQAEALIIGTVLR